MEDTYRHKGLRNRLIDSLKAKGIGDESVLTAMNAIPRHFFLDKAFEEMAYEDQAMPIGEGQTISQPFTVAYQTELLQVQKRNKVLEIGTGSGYQAAVLGAMGARLYTIERHEALYLKAKEMLDSLQMLNVRCYFNDGNKGLGEFAPFDRILVTCGAEEIPQALLTQLAIGGIMVIPVGNSKSQTMTRVKKTAENEYFYEEFDNFRFVPFLSGKNSL
jgi:protein-L-isoaspartate(D-aspartate) O-methyltransferase